MTKIKEKEVEGIRGQETRGEREGQKTKKRVYNGSKQNGREMEDIR